MYPVDDLIIAAREESHHQDISSDQDHIPRPGNGPSVIESAGKLVGAASITAIGLGILAIETLWKSLSSSDK